MTIPPLQPGRDHSINPADAAAMTRRHRELESDSGPAGAAAGSVSGMTVGATNPAAGPPRNDDGAFGGLFSKKAVLSLLSRPDAQFLRYYHARDSDGRRTIILVAADANGNDMLDGGARTLDHHWPCPPYCPPEASALRG